MKNISMNITPFLVPAPMPAIVPSSPGFQPTPQQKNGYSVSFSAHFDNEEDAMNFAKVTLAHMQEYGDRHNEGINIVDRLKERK